MLRLALTHRSYCAEHRGHEPNERLEFLGDAVVGLSVTSSIYDEFPDLPEGQLAKLRASVVNTATLADVAREIDLGAVIRLGRGEELSGGRDKESILADAFEAVIGAVYLDAGWETARDVVLRLLQPHIADGAARPGRSDYKTRLQELTAEYDLGNPQYDITGTGPDHDRRFTAVVLIAGAAHGEGWGTSKKRAEQAAAEAAWTSLYATYTAGVGQNHA